jgi:NAD-dependent dihydropyrimidine dehydrogenase PreA subunit
MVKKMVNERINEDIYRKLQVHLDKMPIGFPRAESGSDLRLLKQLFTPEEAKIATFLKFGWYRDLEPLDQIYQRIKYIGITLNELEKTLDNMVKKGSIMYKSKGKMKFYGNAALILGIYEFQVDKLTKDFLKAFNEYMSEAWGAKANPTDYNQLRIIPVDIGIVPEHFIAPFDNIRKGIEDSHGPFVKANCICRQDMEIQGKKCKMTNHKDNCLAIGDMAQHYIDQGWGTQISKEETFSLLHQNQEEGLIFRPNNAQNFDFICSCCYCCDQGIENLLKIPDPANYALSNYYAEVDPDICTGCGTCLERCQMKAINQIDKICSIERIRCIGCGNCIITCPSEAIMLQKKEEHHIPPYTMEDLYNKILEEKIKLKE